MQGKNRQDATVKTPATKKQWQSPELVEIDYDVTRNGVFYGFDMNMADS